MKITALDPVSTNCIDGVLIDGELSKWCFALDTATNEYSTYIEGPIAGELAKNPRGAPYVQHRHAETIELSFRPDHKPCIHCKRLR